MTKYKITGDHPDCADRPLILRDGRPVNYRDGIIGICQHWNITSSDLAMELGLGVRAVEGWRLGRAPSAESLYRLKRLLEGRR